MHTNGKNSANSLGKELKRCKKNKMLERYWTLWDSPDTAAEECSFHTLTLSISSSTIISTKLATKATRYDCNFNIKRQLSTRNIVNYFILVLFFAYFCRHIYQKLFETNVYVAFKCLDRFTQSLENYIFKFTFYIKQPYLVWTYHDWPTKKL